MKNVSNIGARIEAERQALGLSKTDVWKGAGVSSGMYSQWMNGSEPKGLTLVLLAKLLNVNEKWLATGKGEKHPGAGASSNELDEDEFVPIRRVDFKVSAGVSGYVVEYLNGEKAPIYFRRDWISSRGYDADHLHAIEVSGQSMEPSLWDGDMVVVNTADQRMVDGEVYAFNYEGESVVKRLKRFGGQWFMSSDNSDKTRYPDKLCDGGCQIIGRVVHKQSERI
ncbi:MAG TPA: S24 family peptidase [Methylovorus sp.]|nr:S24 family peptidase [Methylovorus sp.]